MLEKVTRPRLWHATAGLPIRTKGRAGAFIEDLTLGLLARLVEQARKAGRASDDAPITVDAHDGNGPLADRYRHVDTAIGILSKCSRNDSKLCVA